MAEQVSFYDKLKSDMADDIVESATESPKARAATQFATDIELGLDPKLLDAAKQARTQEALDAVLPPLDGRPRESSFIGKQALRSSEEFSQQANRLHDRLNSERAMRDPYYRAQVLKNLEVLGAGTRPRRPSSVLGGVDGGRYVESFGYDEALDQGADNLRVERRSLAPKGQMERMFERDGRYFKDPVINELAADRVNARRMFDEAAAMPPGAKRDAELARTVKLIKDTEHRLSEGMAARQKERAVERAAKRAAEANQLDLYRDAKKLVERYGDDALRAGKRVLNSPGFKRGLGVAAGLMGSKIATAATSGGADLVQELAFGAPKAFIQGYNRSQEPYEQVKYVAEEMGPIDNLQRMSLNALSYDDVVRLRQEGHLTPKAQQQYRQHVIKTEGFDPDEVYRRQ